MRFTDPNASCFRTIGLVLAVLAGAMVASTTDVGAQNACEGVECPSGMQPALLGERCYCITIFPVAPATGGSPVLPTLEELKCRVPCPDGYRHGANCDCRPTISVQLRPHLKQLRKRLKIETKPGQSQYTCESTTNTCTCDNNDPLDCIDLIADSECTGTMTGPDGNICLGQPGKCTCKWH